MKVPWKMLGFGVLIGSAFVQLLWFSPPSLSVRIFAAIAFIVVSPGVFLGSKKWAVIAFIEITFLLLGGIAFFGLAPSFDVPATERVNLSTAFLVTRDIFIVFYSILMLWALSTRLRVSSSR